LDDDLPMLKLLLNFVEYSKIPGAGRAFLEVGI
jgi:hypothetical protein